MSDISELASRIRARVALDPRVTEKKMFGGIAFMLDGNMFAGITGKGELMVRRDKANEAKARALPGADQVDFEAKRKGGFLFIPADAVEEESHLDNWVQLAHAYVGTLPPK